jgi:hypothetical protein
MTIQEKDRASIFEALDRFTRAAIDLDAMWEAYSMEYQDHIGELLSTNYPKWMPSFGEAVCDIITWREAQRAIIYAK